MSPAMRDALVAWGAVAAAAAPLPEPPILPSARSYVRTPEQWEALRTAYHDPEVVHPSPYGDDCQETRAARLCRVVVDKGNGLVLRVTFVERHDDGPSSLLYGKPRSLPRGRGGGGSRGPADYGELVDMLIGEGCTVTMAKRSGHREVTLPDRSTVQMASTPSDHRTLLNDVAKLRRKGLKLTKF